MGSWPVWPIPNGNATGLSTRSPGLTGKQLELLKAAVPQVSRVTILYNPVLPVNRLALQEAREAARTLALELQVLEVRQRHDLASAFAALTAWRAGAALALSGPPMGNRPLLRRSRFQAWLRPGITPHKLECPARKEEVHETHTYHCHALRRSRGTSGG
jgi:hypothetical protein